MSLQIDVLPVLDDNYIFILTCTISGVTAAVDPATFDDVDKFIATNGGRLDYILNTHHHFDHVGGNLRLKEKYGCMIIGSGEDARRIPGIDRLVSEGDQFEVGSAVGRVIGVDGHTVGHISYYFGADQALFCGDTLFSMGCGRLFEGTPATMWQSLSKLRDLPDNTQVYCAHEYTKANGKFALTVEPDNVALVAYCAEVAEKRRAMIPTIPTNLGREKQVNPFLRADQTAVRLGLGCPPGAAPSEVFAALRSRKDNF